MSRTTAAILAGGLGTRLRSVVADRPKVLAPVLGRPYLAYLLEQVATAGIRKCVLCTGHMADQVQAAFGEDFQGMELLYSREDSPLGTGGALRQALPGLTGDRVLVLNGDSYCDVDLLDFQKFHAAQCTDASMVLVRVADSSRFGRVSVGVDGRIQRFEEKTPGAGPGWINAGIYCLSPGVIAGIPEGQAVSLEREVFPGLVARGMSGYQTEGQFLDIGTPESYAAAERFLATIIHSDQGRSP